MWRTIGRCDGLDESDGSSTLSPTIGSVLLWPDLHGVDALDPDPSVTALARLHRSKVSDGGNLEGRMANGELADLYIIVFIYIFEC